MIDFVIEFVIDAMSPCSYEAAVGCVHSVVAAYLSLIG